MTSTGDRLTAARREARAVRQGEPPLVNDLASIRRSRGLTQVELAERAGVSREAISFIERGVNEPSMRLALRLGLVLQCPVEVLFRLPNGAGGSP